MKSFLRVHVLSVIAKIHIVSHKQTIQQAFTYYEY